MKPSFYNRIIQVDGSMYVLLNLLYKNAIVFSQEKYDAIKKLLDCGENNSDPRLSKLMSDWSFLIQEDFEEMDYLKYRYLSHLFDSKHLNLLLTPTLQCNFDCKYCFQTRQDAEFNPDTVKNILEFTRRQMSSRKHLQVTWFGGEPLLKWDLMNEMTDGFHNICKHNNCTYSATMSTNGSLLDDATISRLPDLDIRSVQITLDGPPWHHNKLRPFQGGRPSFECLRKNLEALSSREKKTFIYLRVNVSDESYKNATDMLDIFSDNVKKNTFVYFRFINPSAAKGCVTFVKDPNESAYWDLYYKTILKGWNTRAPETMKYISDDFFHCLEGDQFQHVSIGPDGTYFTCSESFFTEEDTAVAKLRKGGSLAFSKTGMFLKFYMHFPFEEQGCKGCTFLPLCFGGCRLKKINNAFTCKKSHMPANVEGIAKSLFLEKKRYFTNGLAPRGYRGLHFNKNMKNIFPAA